MLLPTEELVKLRPYGFDLRLPLVVDDEQTLDAWTTVAPVNKHGVVVWPVRAETCYIVILSGPRRGQIASCNTSELAHALGH